MRWELKKYCPYLWCSWTGQNMPQKTVALSAFQNTRNWIYLISIHHASKRILSIFKCFFELFDVNLIKKLNEYGLPILSYMWSSDPKDALMSHSKQVDCTNTAFYDQRYLVSSCLVIVIKTASKYLWQSNCLDFAFSFLHIWSWQCLWTELLNNQTLLQVFILCFLLLNPARNILIPVNICLSFTCYLCSEVFCCFQ